MFLLLYTSQESYPLVKPDNNNALTASLKITDKYGADYEITIQQEVTEGQPVSLLIEFEAGQPELYWKAPSG